MHFIWAIDPMTSLQAIRIPGPYLWREKKEKEGSRKNERGEGGKEGRTDRGKKKGRQDLFIYIDSVIK